VLHTAADQLIGEPVRLDGSAVSVRLVADPVTKELSVIADGRSVLFSFAVPAGTMIPSSSFALTPDRSETLCRQLQRRR
jgi:hypothetical protein